MKKAKEVMARDILLVAMFTICLRSICAVFKDKRPKDSFETNCSIQVDVSWWECPGGSAPLTCPNPISLYHPRTFSFIIVFCVVGCHIILLQNSWQLRQGHLSNLVLSFHKIQRFIPCNILYPWVFDQRVTYMW